MIRERGLFGGNTRANAEILFIALLTASVVAVGAAGITLANSTTADTSEQVDQPDFETVEDGDISIEYEDGPLLSHYDETEEIRIHDGNVSHTVYNDSRDYDLKPGEPLVTPEEAAGYGIEPDSTIEIVWERTNGESEVVEEMYIPDENVSGMNHGGDGNLNTTADNVSSTVCGIGDSDC